MITISRADAKVVKSSTILSAYIVAGGVPADPVICEDLRDDMDALSQLEETVLVYKSKVLVKLTIDYVETPNEFTQSCAKQALDELADALMQTKEK